MPASALYCVERLVDSGRTRFCIECSTLETERESIDKGLSSEGDLSTASSDAPTDRRRSPDGEPDKSYHREKNCRMCRSLQQALLDGEPVEAYHRANLRRPSREKPFIGLPVPYPQLGLYEYLVMPFGLANAPAHFQSFINDIFRDIIRVDNEEAHIWHVTEVLTHLRSNQLFAKLSKCKFHTTTVEFLGYIIKPTGIEMDPEKVRTIKEWPMLDVTGSVDQ
ncbi:uncharacterized protein UHOR_03685 [Ustilago hordei]|uniref:Reverse transcriptase domain-containing protein n=1 Tax=Ustilago hordei TaxID=120017 RepID=I2FYZ4_USTHO|nr:uncharacterized protein UHOR_03685 [Ustilago hordei]